MIPSRRLYLLLLLGGAIAIPLGMGSMLIYDLILLILAFLDGQKAKANRVEVSRLPLNRLSIGRDNPVIINLKSKNRAAQVYIDDDYPQEFSTSAASLKTRLQPKESSSLSYSVCPHQRGEFTWGDLQLRQLGNWGLTWDSWKISSSQKVTVYPDLLGLRSLSIRLALLNTGSIKRSRRIGLGTEFSELKEYNQSDDLRLIDWKATARRNRPYVRVLEPEREQTLIILLDRGRLMNAQVQGLKRFDWGLNATLSLALTGLNRGDQVGVGVFDRQIITWIPPRRGQTYFPQILERLTNIQPTLWEPDYGGAVSQSITQQTRRALVVLITDIVDEIASSELLGAMVHLTPRYLPFCVALRDPQVDLIAHTATNSVPASYSRAVALDLLSSRQLAFAKLKQQGVLVLDAPANQISDQLVDRYLHLKARNLL